MDAAHDGAVHDAQPDGRHRKLCGRRREVRHRQVIRHDEVSGLPLKINQSINPSTVKEPRRNLRNLFALLMLSINLSITTHVMRVEQLPVVSRDFSLNFSQRLARLLFVHPALSLRPSVHHQIVRLAQGDAENLDTKQTPSAQTRMLESTESRLFEDIDGKEPGVVFGRKARVLTGQREPGRTIQTKLTLVH